MPTPMRLEFSEELQTLLGACISRPDVFNVVDDLVAAFANGSDYAPARQVVMTKAQFAALCLFAGLGQMLTVEAADVMRSSLNGN